jgi:glucose-1-phosphate cytidylyltransferase
MHSKSSKEKIVVLLCGGRGSRMGFLTKKIPKPLLLVHKKPIIYHIITNLIKNKFTKFIFPLGYKGEMIKSYLKKTFSKNQNKFFFEDTGVNSSISKRVSLIKKHIPKNKNFFLINSDTIFNFNINKMFNMHIKKKKYLTLLTVDVLAKWGLLIFKKKKLIDLSRSRVISNLEIKNSPTKYGKIYSGLCFLNEKALKFSNTTDFCFESSLYKKLIKQKKTCYSELNGSWSAIDTEKDLQTINLDKKIKFELNKN